MITEFFLWRLIFHFSGLAPGPVAAQLRPQFFAQAHQINHNKRWIKTPKQIINESTTRLKSPYRTFSKSTKVTKNRELMVTSVYASWYLFSFKVKSPTVCQNSQKFIRSAILLPWVFDWSYKTIVIQFASDVLPSIVFPSIFYPLVFCPWPVGPFNTFGSCRFATLAHLLLL